MPAPQISDDIKVRNGTLTRGRFEVPFNDPVSISFRCSSSGNSNPSVKFSIDWGDEKIDIESGLVGQSMQLDHVYENVGDYNIAVSVLNSDGLRSAQPKTASVRIPIIDIRKKDLYRWRGIALPRTTLDVAIQSVQDTYPPVSYTLSVSTQEGDFEVYLNSDSISDLQEAEYTISQQGKLYSSGRIIKTDGNKIVLDTAVNDSYDANVAELEVHSRSIASSSIPVRTKDYGWIFKASTDEELVRSSFITNLAVRKGERVMLPEFGSNLHLIPFEQNDITTRQLLRLEVADPITTWEPRAEIVDTVINSMSNNEVEISMSYRYTGGSRDSTFTALIPLRVPEAIEA